DKNFTIIQGEEITTRFEGRPIHINATNLRQVIPPGTGKSALEVMQSTIYAVNNQRKNTGVPMFPHINHPNMDWAISVDELKALQGERFFEVYNGHPIVKNYGDATHPGTEQVWDLVNAAYAKRGQPLLFGLATDDTHNYHQFGTAFSNAGRGWVMVRSSQLDAAALVEAMERGDFYATTGVILEDLNYKKNTIDIRVKEEPGVNYAIEFLGASSTDGKPLSLGRTDGGKTSFK